MKKIVFGMTALAALSAAAHSMSMNKVGFKETGGVHVAEGTVTASEDIILDRAANFYKTGLGTFSLSLARLNHQQSFSMTVYGGTLEFTGGADSTVDASYAPEVCWQKAAFWVDPTSTVPSGETGVARWCDVREPNATRNLESTPKYLYADAAWYNAQGDNNGAYPVKTEKYGRDAVYFGGHQSGKYMKWSKTVEPIQHIFLVHGCFDTFGAAIGYSGGSRKGGFVPQFSGGSTKLYSDLTFTLFTRSDCSGDALSIQAFVDGEPTDLSATRPKKGFQLLECSYAPACTRADTFFLTSFEQLYGNDSRRQGGDYISEAIVFTNQLTEAQRLDVQRYLMKKWSLPRDSFADDDTPNTMVLPKPVGSVGIAAGTTARFNIIEAGAETSPFDFRGEGDVVKSGAGALVVGNDDSGIGFNGSLTLSGGSVIARQGGRLPPLRLEGGRRYTAEAAETEGSATAELTGRAGLRLSAVDISDSAKVVKAGDGWAVANSVAAGVGTICVNGGVLQLSAKSSPTIEPVGANACVTGIIYNADFEQPFEEQDGKGWSAGMSGSTINSWVGSGFLRYYSFGGWAYSAYGSGYRGQAPLDGVNVLHLSGNGRFLSNKIWLPESGVYELDCLMRARVGGVGGGANKDRYLQLEVGMCAYDVDAPERFACVTVNDGPWQRIRLRLPHSEAGQYRICFTTLDNGGGDPSAVNVDDMRLTLVPERDAAVAFKIPNGDFEHGEAQPLSPFRYADYSANNLLEGWTFGAASGTSPSAGFTGLTKFISGYNFPIMLYNYYDRPIGTGALAMLGASATASTSFTAPAGTFRLRASLARNSVVARLNGGSSESYFESAGSITAVLTLADETQINLGAVSPSGRLAAEKLWPTAFTIPESQTVTLTLSQSGAGATVLDDLVFVNPPAASGELVKDTSFDDTSHDYWQRIGTSAAKVKYTQSPINAYGYAVADGDWVARFSGTDASYHQTLNFPSSGLYRLRIKARTRAGGGQWACNPFRFTLHPEGHAENAVQIGRIDPMPLYRQFVGFEYLFRVDTPGNHVLTLGVVDHSDTDVHAGERQSFIDGVSVTKVTEEVQPFSIPETTCFEVSDGGQLHLDFTNTVTISGMKINGRRVYGVIDRDTYPDIVTGLGALVVPASKIPGTLMLVK